MKIVREIRCTRRINSHPVDFEHKVIYEDSFWRRLFLAFCLPVGTFMVFGLMYLIFKTVEYFLRLLGI